MWSKGTEMYGLPPQNPWFQSNHKKNKRPIPTEAHILQNTWPECLKTVQVVKNKESLRNLYSQVEPKKTWQLYIVWCVGWDPGTEKKDIRLKKKKKKKKTKEIWVNYELQLIIIIIILVTIVTNLPY